jgi:hypothetical protein
MLEVPSSNDVDELTAVDREALARALALVRASKDPATLRPHEIVMRFRLHIRLRFASV